MLGTRTKQVNSYGRRGSRIVNVTSDRRDRESANSSEAASDVDALPPPRTFRRDNIISPAKPHPGLRRFKGSSRSPRGSPLTQNRNVQPKAMRNSATKRIQSKLDSSTRIRQPLTPIRLNGTSEYPSSRIKGKSKASTVKPTRTSLKPHAPVIAVDIIILDQDGNMLTQERRLSHTEIQANQVCTATGKDRKIPTMSLPSPPPITISDDSDLEVVSPYPVVKRLNRRPRAIVISSDESEANDKGIVRKKPPAPLAKSHSRSKLLRAEVVVQIVPSRKSKVSKKPPRSPPLTLTPSRTPALPAPSFRPGPAAVPSLLVPPIPIAKPRQLTPIRGSSSRSIFRRPSPTPSTPTEADLSLDLAQLDLSDATEIDDLASAQPEYLVPLLNECAQTSPYEFSAFIETFPFDPIVQSSAEDEDVRFRKIGEASYSEVFGIGDVVLKIIPIRFEEESTHPEMVEIPAPSDAKDVLKEIIVTRATGEICDKFVELLKTYVVRGRYPSLLLDLWDEYNEKKGSESIRPGKLQKLTDPHIIIEHHKRRFVRVNAGLCHYHTTKWRTGLGIICIQERFKVWLAPSLWHILASRKGS
jgi:serine/threonine-protein kinase haspin